MEQTHSGCVCGAVRYRITGKPNFVAVCHCKFCQRRLASAFDEKNVEVTQGELSECEHRSDESSRWLKMNFCPACGTTVYHTAEVRPGMKTIAAGTFGEQGWFAIDRHSWVQSKLPWVAIPEGAAVYQKAFTPSLQANDDLVGKK